MATRLNPSKGSRPDKIMRDALSIELHREVDAVVDGKTVKIKRYRRVMDALVTKGENGDTSAIREINERMDGKIPQAIVGDDDYDPIQVVTDENRAKALAALLAKTAAGTEPK